EADAHVEAVDVAGRGETVGAVLGVHAVVEEGDLDPFQRDLFAFRVEMQRHRRADAEGGGEEVVRRWPLAIAARGRWLVGDEVMRADADLVTKRSVRADDDRFHGGPPYSQSWVGTASALGVPANHFPSCWPNGTQYHCDDWPARESRAKSPADLRSYG